MIMESEARLTIYAQTNLQLWSQLRGSVDDPEAYAAAGRAYALALRLHGKAIRGTGKPFISHLVGVASIAAAHGGTPEEVSAALLHAAYAQGDFGDGSRGLSDAKRQALVKAMGGNIEVLVYGYTQLDWSKPAIEAMTPQCRDYDHRHKSMVFLRLANELEDALDDALAYSHPAKAQSVRDALRAAAPLARALGHDALAGEMDQALAADAERGPVPDWMVSRLPVSGRLKGEPA